MNEGQLTADPEECPQPDDRADADDDIMEECSKCPNRE